MVITLAIPLRAAYGLHDLITERHLQNMAKVLLATGLIVAYGYFMEWFMAWYGGNPLERYVLLNRLVGPYRFGYWGMLLFNIGLPQLLWLQRVREAGYRRSHACVPFPVEGLTEALGFRRTWIPLLVLAAARSGAAGAYFMQWYAMGVWYPLNVGGRPLNSWPMFIPITFELAVLVGGLTAVPGMLALNRLPTP